MDVRLSQCKHQWVVYKCWYSADNCSNTLSWQFWNNFKNCCTKLFPLVSRDCCDNFVCLHEWKCFFFQTTHFACFSNKCWSLHSCLGVSGHSHIHCKQGRNHRLSEKEQNSGWHYWLKRERWLWNSKTVRITNRNHTAETQALCGPGPSTSLFSRLCIRGILSSASRIICDRSYSGRNNRMSCSLSVLNDVHFFPAKRGQSCQFCPLFTWQVLYIHFFFPHNKQKVVSSQSHTFVEVGAMIIPQNWVSNATSKRKPFTYNEEWKRTEYWLMHFWPVISPL